MLDYLLSFFTNFITVRPGGHITGVVLPVFLVLILIGLIYFIIEA